MSMRVRVLSLIVVLLLTPVLKAQTPAPHHPAAPAAPAAPSLVGTWKAATERLPLTGEFNEKVWGKNATSVRDVSLVIKAGGNATLTVSRKVLDARGRVVPGSPSIEEAEITIGDATPGFATRLEHDVRVVKGERRYPDNGSDRWPLDQLVVPIVTFSDDLNAVEVRFEPADGQGSFSELLTRGAARTRT